MNKVLRMSLLALATVALMGSCKKKSNGEPDPNGTQVTPGGNGGNNGGGNNGGGGTQTPTAPASTITLTLPAGQKFALKGVEGDNITIGGVAVENFAYKSDNQPKEFSSQTGTVEIKGNIKSLTFSAGAFDKLEVPNGLETLRMLDGSKTASLDLTKAVSLQTLNLSASALTSDLDLRGNTNLKNVTLSGGVNTGKTYLPTSVEMLSLNRHYKGFATDITTANFPKLSRLVVNTVSSPVDVNMSGSTALKNVFIYSSGAKNLVFANAKSLSTAIIYNANGFSSIDMSGCSALVDYQKSSEAISLNDTGARIQKNEARIAPSFTTLNLSGVGITAFDENFFGANPYLANVNLSGSKVAVAKFTEFKALKTLDLTNTALAGSSLTEALKTLPATNGTIKIAGLSASDAAIVAQRGWTVAQ